jgi:hypothetical protein
MQESHRIPSRIHGEKFNACEVSESKIRLKIYSTYCGLEYGIMTREAFFEGGVCVFLFLAAV